MSTRMVLRNMSGFSLSQGLDRWDLPAFFRPIMVLPLLSLLLIPVSTYLGSQWKHVGKHYNGLSCLLSHQGQWLVMDNLLWPVILPILPTGSSGGTSLNLTSQKSVMVSQSGTWDTDVDGISLTVEPYLRNSHSTGLSIISLLYC